MIGLKKSLERFYQLATEVAEKEESNLRFKARFLMVSEIAQQYFCEKKVEMDRIHGEEETPEMRLGKDAHELLLKDTVRVKLEELWRKIYSGKPVCPREMTLLGKHNGIIIAGLADAVFFYGGAPFFLFEHKFTSRQVPFKDQHVQAGLYCYLLHLMGWDTSKLKYTLVIAPPKCRDDKELRRIPSYVLQQPKEGKLKVKLQAGNANIYVNSFDMKKVIDDLNWALGFWTEERPPKPTMKIGKCATCQFKEICGSSLTHVSNQPQIEV